jgi:hypothetical protein
MLIKTVGETKNTMIMGLYPAWGTNSYAFPRYVFQYQLYFIKPF